MAATPRHDHTLLLAALLLACACACASAGAQPTPPQGNYGYTAGQQEVQVSTTMVALLAAVVGVFLFIAFSTIYLRHCTGYYDAGSADRRSVPADPFLSFSWVRQRRPRGLAAGVIETFPTMKYREAKALRVGKVGPALECAVCLSEFEDEERLRLLPQCSHAFHPDCIGEWLAGHVTCPFCRCNLDPTNKDTSSDEPSSPAPEVSTASSEIAVARQQDDGAQQAAAVVIDVAAEEEELERSKEAMELERIGAQRRLMRSRSGRRPRLVRSHSTGHSVAVRLDRDLERFTLRLPEHLRRELVATGEQSARRGRRGRLGRAGKWPSFLTCSGTLSGSLPYFSASRISDSSDGGELSTSSASSTKVKGKRVAAIDVADGTAKESIRVGGTLSGAKVGAGLAAPTADMENASTRQVRK